MKLNKQSKLQKLHRTAIVRGRATAQRHTATYGVFCRARELKIGDLVTIVYDIKNTKGTLSTFSSVAGYWADGKRRRKQEPLFVDVTKRPVKKRL